MKQIKKVIILGIGGTSRDILDIVQGMKYQCIGFLDDDKSNWGRSINGIKVFGPLGKALSYKDAYFINGIGSPLSFLQKEKIIARTNLPINRFATLVHPSANISLSSTIGLGSVIFPNVVISSNAKIGSHTVILPNSAISHDVKIGNYCCIASGVCISGSVRIGDLCYLGTGSLIKDGIYVENKSLIGMGSVVVSNVKKSGVYVGNPAKFLRPN